MEKVRHKITLNWQGQVFEYFRHANSEPQALRHSIRVLAREVGYSVKYVQNYIMDTNHNRWEVTR